MSTRLQKRHYRIVLAVSQNGLPGDKEVNALLRRLFTL